MAPQFAPARSTRSLSRTLLAGLGPLAVLGVAAWPQFQPAAEQEPVPRSEEERDRHDPEASPEGLRLRALERAGPGGVVPQGAMLSAWNHRQQMVATAQLAGGSPSTAGVSVSSWQSIGPGNAGGRVRSIAIHPTAPERIWVGTAGGGVWKSENGGARWEPMTSLPAFLPIADVVLDPVDPDVMYVATGENYGMSSGEGVFKSTDGGTSWTHLANTAGLDVNELRISPTDRNLLIAAAQDGIWRSGDAGSTWTQEETNRARDLAFDPTDGTRILVGHTNGKVRRSTDAGLNWSVVYDLGDGRVEVAFAPSDPQIVYATSKEGQDLHRSTDGGATFSPLNTTTDFFGSLNQGSYDNVIWVDPTDTDTLLVGGVPLWRSMDGGVDFGSHIGEGGHNGMQRPHSDQHAIVHHPDFDGVTNKTVYVGNDGGIFRTDDVYAATATSGWLNLNQGLGITQFYEGASDPSGQLFIGGTQDNGTQWFTGNPDTWGFIYGGDGFDCAIDPRDPDVLYMESQFGVLQRSLDGGRTRTRIGSALVDNFPFNTVMEMDPHDPSRLYVVGEQVWRTDDALAADPVFVSVKAALSTPTRAHAFAIDPQSADRAWVCYENGEIYRTMNATSASPTWIQVDPQRVLPQRMCTSLAVDPRFPGRVFATFNGLNPDNVWRTLDGGQTWTDMASALPAVQCNRVAFHPLNPGWVYVGTDLGVFLSEDYGSTWSADFGPTQSVAVEDLFFAGGRLFAVTFGLGVYVADPATIQVPEDQPTIQAAINAAVAGVTTTIDIGPGVHVGAVNTNGKKVILVGRDGVDHTVLTVSGSGAALVRSTSGEGSDTVFRDLTITAPERRGLRVDGSSPFFDRCRFVGCRSNADGGAAWISNGSAVTFRDCEFLGNVAAGAFGALTIDGGSSVEMWNCVVASNRATTASPAVHAAAGCTLQMAQCTVTANQGGVEVTDGVLDLFNSILWGNAAEGIDDLVVSGSTAADVQYCDIGTGPTSGTGNLSADPLFADAAYDDYRLLPGSPCLDAGSGSLNPLLLDADLRGCPREADSDLAGGHTVNLGAHESIPLDAGDFASLQAAVDAAENCAGVVSVPPGSYGGSINLRGKSVLVVAPAGGVVMTRSGAEVLIAEDHESRGAVFSGFLIQQTGFASANAIRCSNGSEVTLRNCVVDDGFGTGLRVDTDARPLVLDCEFLDRSGAGVQVRFGARARFERCRIAGNYNFGSAVGGISAVGASMEMYHCLVEGNTGGEVGGVRLEDDQGSILVNCSILYNAGGSLATGMEIVSFADPAVPSVVTNCIVWGSSIGTRWRDVSGGASVSYSDIYVTPVVPGPGNLNVNPGFVGLGPTLGSGSPCIDAGDTTSLDGRHTRDLDGRELFCDLVSVANTGIADLRGAVDMGCSQAARTSFLDVGLGKAGAGGVVPVMSGSGAECFDDPLVLRLSGAAVGQFAAVAIGVFRIDLPLLGGTLVPSPIDAPTVLTDAQGVAELSFLLPASVVGTIWVQAWVLDPAASESLSASNGLGVVVE